MTDRRTLALGGCSRCDGRGVFRSGISDELAQCPCSLTRRQVYARLAVAHFLLAAILFAACAAFACAHDPSAELVERYRPTLEDAGLGWGLGRLNGLTVKVHPQSDGTGWTPAEPVPCGRLADGGQCLLTKLYDYGGEACYSFPGERVLWVRAYDEYVCHGLAHAARTDIYRARLVDGGHGCLDRPSPDDDHSYFAATGLDRKCREVMAP